MVRSGSGIFLDHSWTSVLSVFEAVVAGLGEVFCDLFEGLARLC